VLIRNDRTPPSETDASNVNASNVINDTNSCKFISDENYEDDKIPVKIEETGNKLIMNRSFSDHPLWYEEKLTHQTELLPLFKYSTNSTKRILAWSKNWNNLPEYYII